MNRETLRHVLLIVLVEIVSFRLFALALGFYHDDWVFLHIVREGGGFLGAVSVFAKNHLGRPVQIIQLPLFYSLASHFPPIGQFILMILGSLEGILLYLLLHRLTGRRGLALTAAVLTVMFPNRAIVHVWLSNATQPLAHVLTLASFLLHLRWLDSGEKKWLIAGLASFLTGMLAYETTYFLPLLLAGGLLVRSRRSGADGRQALRKTFMDMLPYVLPLAMALLWQRWGVRFFFDVPPKAVEPSIHHFFKALGAGFECVTNRVVHICALSLVAAIAEFRWPFLILWAGFTGAAAYLFRVEPEGRVEDARTAEWTLVGAGVLGWLGAYLPYALSGNYMPQIFGLMSRNNGAGAWTGGLLLAAGLSALGRGAGRRAQVLALMLVIGPFTWTNWHAVREYAESWRVQQDILAKVAASIAPVQGPATILLASAPSFVGKAVVFDSFYDFSSALKLTTGREELSGNILTPRIRFEEKEVIEVLGGAVLVRYPYDNLYLYDYGYDSLYRITGPGAFTFISGSPIASDKWLSR